jgi:ribosomal protein L35AE/L33A
MHVTKRVDLVQLGHELDAATVPHNGLGLSGTETDGDLYTFTATGEAEELPPAAVPVVDAHVAAPRLIEFASRVEVHAIVRTTSASVLEVFRFACDVKHVYQSTLTISGVDAANGATKIMEGRFGWKRWAAGAVVMGVTVVSDIHDAAAAAWAPNFHVETNEVVFTVQGAAGRTIDWLLVGSVDAYAPTGIGG